MKIFTALVLAATLAASLLAAPATSLGASESALPDPETSCVHMSIREARHTFRLLDGNPSRARDWTEIRPDLLYYQGPEEVEGRVPPHASAIDDIRRYISLRGAYARASYLLVHCIPRSHLPHTYNPERFYPQDEQDAWDHWGGSLDRWHERHPLGNPPSVFLVYEWSNYQPKLEGFTVPYQCEVIFSTFSRMGDGRLTKRTFYAEPGDEVPPVRGLRMGCHKERSETN